MEIVRNGMYYDNEGNTASNGTDGNTCHKNPGIVCQVKNCVYHDGDMGCTANKISVGPSNATNSNETLCATFREKGVQF